MQVFAELDFPRVITCRIGDPIHGLPNPVFTSVNAKVARCLILEVAYYMIFKAQVKAKRILPDMQQLRGHQKSPQEQTPPLK